MPYLLGTDEAGYGPNLGPLVISASVWEVPCGAEDDDLYERLSAVIARPRDSSARKQTGHSGGRFVIGDSKALYHSGNGLAQLERGLWAAMGLLGRRPAICGEVWAALAGDDCGPRREALCGGCDARSAPCDLDAAETDRRLPDWCAELAVAGVRLVDLCSVAIHPREFNETISQCESKGTALSRWTLALASRLIQGLPNDRIHVVCDKHGGRDRYLPLLCECFPEAFIEVAGEGRARSIYRFGPAERRVEFCFQAKGESNMPTALASMASKYLRELAMLAFNDFWRRHVPDLPPTAGYPLDARRFKDQIAAAQRSLGIEDRIIWRTK
jgi:hypothetical protein